MKENLPLVSIVTPSYNQAKFLEKTIQSVLSQDYPNIEYIIMDGGSTDGSVEIIKKYESSIAYWISEKDKGQSDAINKGWKIAKGKYCAYLNSDDALQPQAVSKIVNAFLANPDAGVIYGDSTFLDQNGKILAEGKGKPCDFKKLLIHGQTRYITQPSSFYLTSLLRDIGYLDEKLHLSMDYDLLLKLAKHSQMIYIPEPISFFRLHSNAKSSAHTKKHWHESLRIKMRYSVLLSLKSVLLYLRFRIFSFMPTFLRTLLRKKRNSLKDRLIIGSSNPS